jgi:tetratricopeptide (TPR) repeat protein
MRAPALAAFLLCLVTFGYALTSSAQFAAGTNFTLPPPPPTPTSSCYGCGGGGNRGGGGNQSRPAPAPTKRDFADPEFDAGRVSLDAYETSHSYSDFVSAESHFKTALAYLPNWGVAHERLCELYGDDEQYNDALAHCQVALRNTGDFKNGRTVKKWLETAQIPWLLLQIQYKAYESGVATYNSQCGSSANANLNNGITILESGSDNVVDLGADSGAQVEKCKTTITALFAQSKSLNEEVASWNKLHP